MRIFATLMSMAILLFAIGASTEAADPSGIEGSWIGTLSAGGQTLRVVFHFSRSASGAWSGALDSPDQGATGIPFDKVSVSGNAVHCEVAAIQGAFEGTLASETRTLSGTWTQLGNRFPLTLKPASPGAAAAPRRPQEPAKPYPYTEEEVTLPNPAAHIELAGTLTKPFGPGPFPAVLLIAGSGPNNRNEEVFGHKPFLVLADSLTRQGIAVLRTDKRGVGRSTGEYASATTEDFVSDALAAVAFLAARSDVDRRHIGLLGHSEGALIAPAAAIRSRDVAFVVLIGAPAVRGDAILVRQGELIRAADSRSSAAFNALNERLQRQMIDAVEQEPDASAALRRVQAAWDEEKARPEAAGLTEQQRAALGPLLKAQMKQMSTPWMRHFLTYDPAPTLRRLRKPVLALYGALDLQVPPSQNAAMLSESLRAAGNPDYTVRELPHLNHLLQPATTGSPAEYARTEETMSPEALRVIGAWILQHSRG